MIEYYKDHKVHLLIVGVGLSALFVLALEASVSSTNKEEGNRARARDEHEGKDI